MVAASTLTEGIDLTHFTEELREYQQIEKEAAFQIGRILSEVKASDVPAGQWTAWLQSVGYNPRTAQRYMQVYERFHAIPAAKGVTIGKLTEFLALPVDVDASAVIEELKGESVRTIRDKVREITGQPSSRPSKLRITRQQTAQQPEEVGRAIAALSNLDTYHAQQFAAGELSAEQAIEAGSFSAEIQAKLPAYYPATSGGIAFVGTLLGTPEMDESTINYAVSKFDEVRRGAVMYDFDAKFSELLRKVEEAAADGFEMIERLDEAYARLQELRKAAQRESRQSSSVFGEKKTVSVAKMLGLPDSADAREIRKKYRQFMKHLHPDHGGSAYLFQMVHEAHESYLGR